VLQGAVRTALAADARRLTRMAFDLVWCARGGQKMRDLAGGSAGLTKGTLRAADDAVSRGVFAVYRKLYELDMCAVSSGLSSGQSTPRVWGGQSRQFAQE